MIDKTLNDRTDQILTMDEHLVPHYEINEAVTVELIAERNYRHYMP